MKPLRFLQILITIALCWGCRQLFAETRVFTSLDGRTLKGELVAMNGNSVSIKREDGQVFVLPAAKFSAADVDYFKAHGFTADPVPRPIDSSSRLEATNFQVLPFCRELNEQALKSGSREFPDELIANMSEDGKTIHIHGKKKSRVAKVNGSRVGHFGKIVLCPFAAQSGKLVAKVPSIGNDTYYYIGFEVPGPKGEALETKEVKLSLTEDYTWSLKIENGSATFRVLGSGKEVASLSGPAEKIKAFGFASTVRYKDNESDLKVTFGE